ncbi:MAG: thioredoxin domain-containing protein [Proteobacteria bacterium]|nr:thioredoxin domain-containing protein [Pseudomonadota bacterium]
MNRLSLEKSPYLQQHKDNPVDWFPWGQEAFEKAKLENKLIFISIGYSTCHWCHVMEREAFEDSSVADVLNRNFVSIKVDREEHPEVDSIFMDAIHLMGQRGGWPLNVFLNPELKPFFGGTYFKKDVFHSILGQIQKLWAEAPEKINESAQSVLEHLSQASSPQKVENLNVKDLTLKFSESALSRFDEKHGGHSGAPKFPNAYELAFLLRVYRNNLNDELKNLIVHTLESMAAGGIFDHIEGGFHRYSTDEKWLIPHFEKMLYDQASLLNVYAEAWQLFKNENFKQVSELLTSYLKKRLITSDGLFYSAEDADSEGEEGLFFVWTLDELQKCLTDSEFDLFSRYFSLSREGNFENGSNVLSLKEPSKFSEAHKECRSIIKKINEHREKRIRPFRDEKILLSWNSLMLGSLAKWARISQSDFWKESAIRTANKLLEVFAANPKMLSRRLIDRDLKYLANLEDYAFFISALIEVSQICGDAHFLERALELQLAQDEFFSDENRAFYYTSHAKSEDLICRQKSSFDNVTPSANSVSFGNLVRLNVLMPNFEIANRIERMKANLPVELNKHPLGFPVLMSALDFNENMSSGKLSIGASNNLEYWELITSLSSSFFPYLLFNVGETKNSRFQYCPQNLCLPPTQSLEEVSGQILNYMGNLNPTDKREM